MTAVELLVHLAVVKTNLPDQSRSAQLESGVRRKAPAPFGRGERLQSPTYPYLGGCEPTWLPGAIMKWSFATTDESRVVPTEFKGLVVYFT